MSSHFDRDPHCGDLPAGQLSVVSRLKLLAIVLGACGCFILGASSSSKPVKLTLFTPYWTWVIEVNAPPATGSPPSIQQDEEVLIAAKEAVDYD